MDSIVQIFGEGKELTIWQMCARSFVMFIIALILIRLGGVRMFGRKSSFDDIIVIMLGAVLSRGVVGASPFLATVAAAAVMIGVHRLLSWACMRNKKIAKVIKGKPFLLYRHGKIYTANLTKASLNEDDLMESLRLETKKNSLDEIDSAFIETNGRISFIDKQKE